MSGFHRPPPVPEPMRLPDPSCETIIYYITHKLIYVLNSLLVGNDFRFN
jgi:hypothetical protein